MNKGEEKERQPQESSALYFLMKHHMVPGPGCNHTSNTPFLLQPFFPIYKPTPFIQQRILFFYKASRASLEYILLVVIYYNLSWQ